jgi:alkanesulfonate monooxygenase SsuD/methylene tetrahydromethanopterin reductase-like flavin-dependent oxidoreductase (luciferase family)
MAYLAAVCPNIDLGTAAVILPWHDPLRVAERAIVVDLLSKGRLRLGMGRGLARREFHAFRGTMDESRERFDEAAAMIVDALRTGFIEGDGKFYKQPRTELRPRPYKPIDGRIYTVASSDDSVVSAAKLNARMVMFADRPWPMRMPAIQKHRDLTRQLHGGPELPPLLADFCICTQTMDGAEEKARQYMGKFVESNFYHYELLGEHFSQVKAMPTNAAASHSIVSMKRSIIRRARRAVAAPPSDRSAPCRRSRPSPPIARSKVAPPCATPRSDPASARKPDARPRRPA